MIHNYHCSIFLILFFCFLSLLYFCEYYFYCIQIEWIRDREIESRTITWTKLKDNYNLRSMKCTIDSCNFFLLYYYFFSMSMMPILNTKMLQTLYFIYFFFFFYISLHTKYQRNTYNFWLFFFGDPANS